MFFNLRKISFALIALFFLNSYAHAGGTSAFEGIVKDHKGKPIRGAEVRVETKSEEIIAKGKTEANGHYVTNALPAGTYKVDVVINSVHRASLTNVKTKNTGPTSLNFEIKAQAAKTMGRARRTGSNL
jgi:hypothetical protein